MLLHLNVGDQVATNLFKDLAKTATNLFIVVKIFKYLKNFYAPVAISISKKVYI